MASTELAKRAPDTEELVGKLRSVGFVALFNRLPYPFPSEGTKQMWQSVVYSPEEHLNQVAAINAELKDEWETHCSAIMRLSEQLRQPAPRISELSWEYVDTRDPGIYYSTDKNIALRGAIRMAFDLDCLDKRMALAEDAAA